MEWLPAAQEVQAVHFADPSMRADGPPVTAHGVMESASGVGPVSAGRYGMSGGLEEGVDGAVGTLTPDPQLSNLDLGMGLDWDVDLESVFNDAVPADRANAPIPDQWGAFNAAGVPLQNPSDNPLGGQNDIGEGGVNDSFWSNLDADIINAAVEPGHQQQFQPLALPVPYVFVAQILQSWPEPGVLLPVRQASGQWSWEAHLEVTGTPFIGLFALTDLKTATWIPCFGSTVRKEDVVHYFATLSSDSATSPATPFVQRGEEGTFTSGVSSRASGSSSSSSASSSGDGGVVIDNHGLSVFAFARQPLVGFVFDPAAKTLTRSQCQNTTEWPNAVIAQVEPPQVIEAVDGQPMTAVIQLVNDVAAGEEICAVNMFLTEEIAPLQPATGPFTFFTHPDLRAAVFDLVSQANFKALRIISAAMAAENEPALVVSGMLKEHTTRVFTAVRFTKFVPKTWTEQDIVKAREVAKLLQDFVVALISQHVSIAVNDINYEGTSFGQFYAGCARFNKTSLNR